MLEINPQITDSNELERVIEKKQGVWKINNFRSQKNSRDCLSVAHGKNKV